MQKFPKLCTLTHSCSCKHTFLLCFMQLNLHQAKLLPHFSCVLGVFVQNSCAFFVSVIYLQLFSRLLLLTYIYSYALARNLCLSCWCFIIFAFLCRKQCCIYRHVLHLLFLLCKFAEMPTSKSCV